MQSKSFEFEDHAQKYYSSVTQDRFFQVITKNSQLSKLLLTRESTKFLQQQSKQYSRTLLYTFGGSLLVLYPINKYLSFGGGPVEKIVKFGFSVGLVSTALYFTNQRCREGMKALKVKIYNENRSNFRKYELSGDVMQANPKVTLVDQ